MAVEPGYFTVQDCRAWLFHCTGLRRYDVSLIRTVEPDYFPSKVLWERVYQCTLLWSQDIQDFGARLFHYTELRRYDSTDRGAMLFHRKGLMRQDISLYSTVEPKYSTVHDSGARIFQTLQRTVDTGYSYIQDCGARIFHCTRLWTQDIPTALTTRSPAASASAKYALLPTVCIAE